MLLLCLGPDTFRAQQKAHELEEAFKQKFDARGLSMERLLPGKESVDEIIQRANTISLFCPRRFIRVANLLSECPKSKYESLAQALAKDPENVIVVDVESDPIPESIMRKFESVNKIIKYDFPQLSGHAFLVWVRQLAAEMRVHHPAIDRLAEHAAGDSWLVWNELMKMKAGGISEVATPLPERSIYEYAEAFLRRELWWPTILNESDLLTQAMTSFVSQARAALRVRDQATVGMHPYLLKRMQSRLIQKPELALAAALRTLLSQRAGLGDERDVAPLFFAG
ncbi:MAG TPA: hypothetical protein VFQ60_04225 [Patescibacteria group bacterium]|nr:hypothetical protein [Patescibacteria group bacterium]